MLPADHVGRKEREEKAAVQRKKKAAEDKKALAEQVERTAEEQEREVRVRVREAALETASSFEREYCQGEREGMVFRSAILRYLNENPEALLD